MGRGQDLLDLLELEDGKARRNARKPSLEKEAGVRIPTHLFSRDQEQPFPDISRLIRKIKEKSSLLLQEEGRDQEIRKRIHQFNQMSRDIEGLAERLEKQFSPRGSKDHFDIASYISINKHKL